MTTIRSMTNQAVLDDANIAKLPTALLNVGFGQLLEDLSAPVEETVVVDATFKATLTKRPIGAVVAARKTGAYLAQTQVDKNCTLGAHQFHVNYQTGVITFETTDFNDTDEAVVTYLGLTAGATSGTDLGEKLAADFED